MLKGIPSNIGSTLLKALADMGHGDTIVIADHFYPAVTKNHGGITVEAKGNGTVEMIRAILQLLPLDTEYTEFPVKIMRPDGDHEDCMQVRPPLWDEITAAVAEYEPAAKIGYLPRTSFYEEAGRAYVTVSTSEEQTYGCVILQKGVR